MDWSVILTFLVGLAPWVKTVLIILGAIVVVGSVIDKLSGDKGSFVAKIMAIPVLGDLLTGLAKFSPFNVSGS